MKTLEKYQELVWGDKWVDILTFFDKQEDLFSEADRALLAKVQIVDLEECSLTEAQRHRMGTSAKAGSPSEADIASYEAAVPLDVERLHAVVVECAAVVYAQAEKEGDPRLMQGFCNAPDADAVAIYPIVMGEIRRARYALACLRLIKRHELAMAEPGKSRQRVALIAKLGELRRLVGRESRLEGTAYRGLDYDVIALERIEQAALRLLPLAGIRAAEDVAVEVSPVPEPASIFTSLWEWWNGAASATPPASPSFGGGGAAPGGGGE